MNWYKISQTETEKKLIICRGISGSGKSTLAKELGKGGVVYSSDDFFIQNGKYVFDAKKLGEAHKWNQNRVEEAMKQGMSPIVADNTNTMKFEIKPYLQLAMRYGYKTEFAQPNWHPDLYTPEGKWNFDFLKGRNTHGVPDEALKKMIDRFQYNLTEEEILTSKAPWEK